ncbi:MAG: LysM peptidoglycan-binding domain-containing protein, partial [Burkholderiaceae bacterium]
MTRSNNVTPPWLKFGGAVLLALSLLELTGCSSRPIARAPVEERGDSKVVQPAPVDSKPLPGLNAANAGKPGYYTVKPGDTIMQIGRVSNQNWRDIVRWNNMDSPNQIEVGQVLRITPPEGTAVATPINPAVTPSKPLPPIVATPGAASAPSVP